MIKKLKAALDRELDAALESGDAKQIDRALTADEIAHNYAIDKARFNLP